MTLSLEIDRFSFYRGFVEVFGVARDPDGPITSVVLRVGGRPVAEGVERGLWRPRPAADGRFRIRMLSDLDHAAFQQVELVVLHGHGQSTVVTDFPGRAVWTSGGHGLFKEFRAWLDETAPGAFLEIGSRARSGVIRRDLIPPAWTYTGMDILEGENVDVVGDAHALSSLLPSGRFKGVMSMSVFEHLAMPWKVAVEMGRIMTVGGRAFIGTHQTYPSHDEPWDFWRFSPFSWPALFNRHTGFRVVETGVSEDASVVPHRWHPGAHHGDAPGWQLSAVIVEKIAEPSIDWPVALSELTDTAYPG